MTGLQEMYGHGGEEREKRSEEKVTNCGNLMDMCKGENYQIKSKILYLISDKILLQTQLREIRKEN